jgi:hypothetical protein
VYKIDQLGSQSGKTNGTVVIVDLGELPMHWRPKQGGAASPQGQILTREMKQRGGECG